MRIFDYANEYIRQCSWKDLALVKFCLCSIGLLLGLLAPPRWRKRLLGGAVAVFVPTYTLLMAKYLRVVRLCHAARRAMGEG